MRMQAVALSILCSLAVFAEDEKDYSIDWDGPLNLQACPRPTQVDIRVTGPQTGVEPAFTWLVLRSRPSDYSTTNQSEIGSLISALGRNQDKDRLENISGMEGYTYHLLLLQSTNHTLMHFKVFDPVKPKTNLCAIYPVTHVHSIYYNHEIGPWLRERVKISTSSEPAGRTKTNAMSVMSASNGLKD